MKKLLFLCTIIIFLFSFLPSNADDISESSENQFSDVLYTSSSNLSIEPKTSSKSIVILDRNTNSILYNKNGYEKVKMASTTKIMTCIIALEKSKSLDEIVTISKKASRIRGSIIGINYNEKYTLKDLLYGLMLHSGNDAAIAIAEHIGENQENFVKMMNEKALELGLFNTHFVSPHGLDNSEHYTTAYELSILSDYALKNDIFKKIVSTKSYSFGRFNFSNTNELLNNFDGIYGIKTGYTAEAGRCLVSACKREKFDLICVVLGAGNKSQRTIDSKNLYNYIFSNYNYYNYENDINNIINNYIKFINNKFILYNTQTNPEIFFNLPYNTSLLINKNNPIIIKSKCYINYNLNSHINPNTNIGNLLIYNNNENNPLFKIDILLKNTLLPNSFFKNTQNIIRNFFNF